MTRRAARQRSVLAELRPPGGWWATPATPAADASVARPAGVDPQPAPRPEPTPPPTPDDPAAAGGGDHHRTEPGAQAETPARPVRPGPVAAVPERETGGSWRDRATCRGIDAELFYPQRGESTAQAKAICAACPVQADCLEHALAAPEKFGIWGGTSERERRHIRRDRRAATLARQQGAA